MNQHKIAKKGLGVIAIAMISTILLGLQSVPTVSANDDDGISINIEAVSNSESNVITYNDNNALSDSISNSASESNPVLNSTNSNGNLNN